MYVRLEDALYRGNKVMHPDGFSDEQKVEKVAEVEEAWENLRLADGGIVRGPVVQDHHAGSGLEVFVSD